MRLHGAAKTQHLAWGPVSAVPGGLQVDAGDGRHLHLRGRHADSLHATAMVIEPSGCTMLDSQGRACSRLSWDDNRWWARVDSGGLIVEQTPWEQPGLLPWLPAMLANSAHPVAPEAVLALIELVRHRPTGRPALATEAAANQIINDLTSFEHSDLSLPPLHADPVGAEIERAIDEVGVLRHERRPYAGDPLPEAEAIAQRVASRDRLCAERSTEQLAELVRIHLHDVTPWPFAALTQLPA